MPHDAAMPSTAPPSPRAPAPPGGGAGLLIGRMIGPYRVLSVLGEGGFGLVYLAEQTHPVRRRVAVKVIKAGMDSRAVVARFEAERQALALMDHPGIAQIHEAGLTEEGRPYFVMEHVQGEPISRFCAQERLSVERRVRLLIQVCSAVQHAHMKGIIHRDLKPSNVLVELVDGEPRARIIDFGVAKALSAPLTDATFFTEQGAMVGTPEYMPPEQARGSGVDVDTRADVYSLGAILYELLTGQTPLDSRELRSAGHAGIQKMIEDRTPIRPSERVSRETGAGRTVGEPATLSRMLRRDLDWIVMKCLEKERSRRYDSAGALARDLERYLADQPVEAGPPSASYRAAKFVRRHKAGVAAAGAVVVGLSVAVALTGWGLSQAVRQRERAKAEAVAAERARAEAEAVTGFLANMLGSVDPAEAGRDATVREVLDRAALAVGPDLVAQPLVEARLRHVMGNTYVALGVLDEADRHLDAALGIRRRIQGESHPDTLRVLGNLAGLRHHQGRYADAERLLRQAIEAWRLAGLGAGPDALGLENNLAQSLSRQGRTAEALELQKRTVEEMARTLGARHQHTLGARNNLAQLLEDAGDAAGAERMLAAAVEGWRLAHGAEHPGTLQATSNLANLYMRLGRLSEAEALQRRMVEVRTRVLGAEHPDTIGTVSNLGLVLLRMGRAADAESLLARAWELAARVMGESHADTLQTALNLSSVYEAQGWPAGAAGRLADLLVTLRSVAARPDATAQDLNAAAWYMLTVEPESLRDAPAALDAAMAACAKERAAGGRDLWQYLDSLALAQFRTGAPASAAASQREAISLVPKEGEGFLGEMRGRLEQYEKAAAEGPPAPAAQPAPTGAPAAPGAPK